MAADALDVLIRGAGPVGCTLALALRGSGLRVSLIDFSQTDFSVKAIRPIALSHASRLILERVGVWSALTPTPIETIHVSQAGGFGHARLGAADAGVPALGYVVEYSDLSQVLREACAGVVAREESPAQCVVHAEGAAPDARQTRYDQDALVALVRTEPAAGSAAFERFTAQGPLAMLPLAGRYALIWSMRPERALELAAAPESRFLEALTDAAGSRPGLPTVVESRSVQPLMLRVRATRIGPRAAYIGNAAQTLHPVAGQGLNLGMRDAWDLAQAWRGASDPGDERVLRRFAARRRLDAAATIGVTHLLAGAFTGSNPILRAARGAALTALDVLPGPRRFFSRRMIFGPSALP